MRWKALAIVAIAAAAACSTLSTTADYDPKTDFTKFKTFAWHDDQSIKDPLVARRVQSAIETTLAAKGMTRNDANPDLWVAVHGRLSEQTQIRTYDTGWGYGYGWRGYGGMGMTTSTVEQIPVGTLIVDLVDAQKKELVWRGTGSDTLNPQRSPEEREKKLQEAIAKMLENYPPKAK